ncbi:hypothetical protein ACHAPJ_003683 [Fusarium lateritium]
MSKGESCLFVKGLVKQAGARLNTSIQTREKESTSYLSSIDEQYEHVYSSIAPNLPGKALTALKKLRAAGEDGIKAIVSSANATQRKDVEMFAQAAEVLKSNAEAQNLRKLKSAEKAAVEAKFQLETYKRKYEGKPSADEQGSTTAPGPAGGKQGNTRTVSNSPGSAGLGFEQALNRTKENPPATPPGEPSSPAAWSRTGKLTKKGSNVLKIRSPAAKSPAWHEPARASPKGLIFRSPKKTAFGRPSSPRFQRKIRLRAEGTGSPLLQEFSNAQYKKDVLWHEKFDAMEPMMRDLLQMQSELNDEWRESLEAVDVTGSDGGKTDNDDEHEGEVDALYDKLSTLNHDLQEKEELISKGEVLIRGQKSQIDNLERKNRELGSKCSELKEQFQGRDVSDQSPEVATPGTPVTGNPKSSRSVRSPAPSGHAGIMASPNTKGVLQQWLDKALHDHRRRLESAVKRCNREEDRCTFDASEMRDDDDGFPEKTTLRKWATSSKNHRRDFQHSIDFIDEIMERTGKTESSSVLSDELEESTSATTMATGTNQVSMNLLKPSDSPTSDYGSHASQTSENTRSNSGGSGPSSGGTTYSSGSSTSDAKSSFATEQGAAEPWETPTTKDVLNLERSSKSETVQNSAGIAEPKDALDLDDVSNNEDTSKSDGSPKNEDISKKEDIPEKQEAVKKGRFPESKDTQAPGSSEQNKSSVSGHDDGNGDDPETPSLWTTFTDIINDLRTTVTDIANDLWAMMFGFLVVVAMQLGAWVRLFKFIAYSVHHCYNLCIGLRRATMSKSTTMSRFPTAPTPQDVLIVVYHVLLVPTLHVCLAAHRERAIWYEANGLTRKYMLKRAAIAPSSTSIFGMDGLLGLGWHDVYDFMDCYHMYIIALFLL